MQRPDLTDLINSRRAWLFVGSGASVASGYPTWQKLLEHTFRRLSVDAKTAARQSGKFERAMKAADYIAAAGHLESVAGRDAFLTAFRSGMSGTYLPNEITRLIANWPFEGYITTNYDHLIERALEGLDARGWITVGNTEPELRKISREPKDLVWHVHGSLQQDRTQSEIIATPRDYGRAYRENSQYLTRLQALLALKEVVFLGFGFNDAELKKVLETVGRLTPPSRPIKAILPDSMSRERREELFRNSHIDPILYHIADDGSHDDLLELLRLHDPFILGRAQEYGNDSPRCEPYDEQTTGMLIYNELTLKRRAETGADVVRAMLQAKVLAKLSSAPCSVKDVTEELERLTIEVHTGFDALSPDFAFAAIKDLATDGRIMITEGGMVVLTPSGADIVNDQRAISDRERDRLSACIYSRVKKEADGILDETRVRRVAQIVNEFLADSIRRRAIGVANALYGPTYQDFPLTVLLQSLREYTGRSGSREEARPLLRVIRDVLLYPTDDERRVLGLMLQAQFAIHMLGFDPATVAARLTEIKSTIFIFDSYYLLHYFAVSAARFDSTRALVESLKALGATIVTTDLFVAEATGHVCRVLANRRGVDSQSIAAYKTATSRGDGSPFSNGYLKEQTRGNAGISFQHYITSVCNLPVKNTRAASGVLRAALESDGFLVRNLRDYVGYTDAMSQELESSAAQLTVRRKERDSWTGPRQTDAEAEALTIVHNIRKKRLNLEPTKFSNAYFVSTTNLVSTVGVERQANILVEPLLQTIAMLRSWTIEEMTILADTMLAEISERNLVVLAPEKLRFVFNPLRVSSRRQIDAVLVEYRELITARLGSEEADRLAAYDDLDLPLVAERFTAQLIELLRIEQDRMRYLQTESRKAKLSIAERRDYQRLKTKEAAKGKKNIARRQSKLRGPQPGRPKRKRTSRPRPSPR